MSSLNMCVVGYGFVGSALMANISGKYDRFIVDPKVFNEKTKIDVNTDPLDVSRKLLAKKERNFDGVYPTLKDITEKLDVIFVCVPTPMGENGVADLSIVLDVLSDIDAFHSDALVVLKSTIVPEAVGNIFYEYDLNMVYNPEFLTERNAISDMKHPNFQIFGGEKHNCIALDKIYCDYTYIQDSPSYYMSPQEAAAVKYGINSFLATKVAWMNQFKEAIETMGCDYNVVKNAIGTDPRIGNSHMDVPGPDGRYGYGGACFPKDTSAFCAATSGFTILEEVVRSNQKIRSQYELDSREKEQNVKY